VLPELLEQLLRVGVLREGVQALFGELKALLEVAQLEGEQRAVEEGLEHVRGQPRGCVEVRSRLDPSPPSNTSQHGSHRQCRRNDAELTTPPKVDTKCTALCLMPTVNGNTVRSFSTLGQQSAAKGGSTTVSRSDIINITF
jgi:hypothetical protein